MSFSSRPLKNRKPLLKCATCLEIITPKNGDWHQAEAGHQYFLCKACELKARVAAKAK